MSILSRNKISADVVGVILVISVCLTFIVGILGGIALYLVHNHHRHQAYVQKIVNSYHYTIGQNYYCKNLNTSPLFYWTPCTVLGVNKTFTSYFIQENEPDVTIYQHLSPVYMTHNGQFVGSPK